MGKRKTQMKKKERKLNTRKRFNNQLDRLLYQHGITSEKAAAVLGVHSATVCRARGTVRVPYATTENPYLPTFLLGAALADMVKYKFRSPNKEKQAINYKKLFAIFPSASFVPVK